MTDFERKRLNGIQASVPYLLASKIHPTHLDRRKLSYNYEQQNRLDQTRRFDYKNINNYYIDAS